MSQQINKNLVRDSFGKRLFSYAQHAVIQTSMADDLVWQLAQAHPDGFGQVLEIGCGSGLLTVAFLKRFGVERYVANDIVENCRVEAAGIVQQYPGIEFDFIGGDIERVTGLPSQLDAVISNATFQWLTDLPAFLTRLKTSVRPGGLLAFSTFGPQNLREIRHLTGVGLQYATCAEVRAWLADGFEVLHCEESVLPLSFQSPRAVLRHIRQTGVNGVTRQAWTKARLREFEQAYWRQFGANDTVPLTYHPIVCVARV